MKIAVINETSAADRNADIISALNGFGHEVFNVGMNKMGEKPELTYIETALLAALLLNTGRVDFVIGGCGTGQGFLNAVMQYPGIFCGLIQEPLDAWLFAQINCGNCISLALNKGYGWAGDINLLFIFERLFSVEWGKGYPEHRSQSQAVSRKKLENISRASHRPLYEILENIDGNIVKNAGQYPGVAELIDIDTLSDSKLRHVLLKYIK